MSEKLSTNLAEVSTDTISRQAAIERFDYIRPRDPMTSDYTHGIDVGIALCKVAIREQPPAQLSTNLAEVGTDCISRQAIDKFIDGLEEIFADLRERHVDDSVCGLCEYDGAYIGQSGDWCNECPGFDKDDCFKLSDKTRKEWTEEIIKALPPAQPERRCVNCGRTVNNGGWYEDGRTRCPIEEHYALPKDGYCHLWEKRKDWEDDYVKRAEEGEK